MKPDPQERPDFEKAAEEYYGTMNAVLAPGFIAGAKYADDLSRKRIEELETALNKINAIRNSIVGMQGFNFSEHAYPLVAALNEAGFEGMQYPEALENFGTMLERTNKAKKRIEELEALLLQETGKCMKYTQEIEDLKKRVPSICANTLHNDQVKKDGYCHLCKSNLLK